MHLGIKTIIGGAGKYLFGNGVYNSSISGSGVTVAGNNVTITGAATVAPDGTTGAAVVVCDTLTLDGASASLAPSTNCKGLIVFAKTKIELRNGAKLNIDKLGKAGNFGNLTVLDLVPDTLKRKLKPSLAAFVVLGEGAPAQGPTTANSTARTGNAAGAMQTGGGGEGAGYGSPGGGKGGPCCGGAGGGGDAYTSGDVLAAGATIPGDYGGPGGNAPTGVNLYSGAAGGGAGDPVGAGRSGAAAAGGAGGGLLMLFTPAVSIASGCVVSADGAAGGGTGTQGRGGSAGGGCVVIVTPTGGYANAGTVRASGGPSGGSGGTAGSAGGAGSVNILTVS